MVLDFVVFDCSAGAFCYCIGCLCDLIDCVVSC